MTGLYLNLGRKARIGILRALQFGDLLCAVPAFRALRTAYPDAEISLIGLPWSHSFVTQFRHLIDNHITFPGYPGLPEQPPDIAALPPFLIKMQEKPFDLVLQMHGSGSIVNPLVSLLGGRISAGFYSAGTYRLNNEYYLEYPSHEPEIWRLLRLIEFLGIPLLGDYLEFPILDQDKHRYKDLQRSYSLVEGQYACIHPGARSKDRRWSISDFASIADNLAGRGYQIVLTGTQEEQNLTGAVESRMMHPAVNMAGVTDLGVLAAVLSHSRLLVSNDTGVSHLADALHVPSVIIFSTSDPHRWAPFDRDVHRVVFNPNGADLQDVVNEVDVLLLQERTYVQ